MTTFSERLPERKSSPRSGIRWTPAEGNDFSPVAGELLIDTKRARVVYRLSEFPTDFPGRGFHLEKLTDGTDKSEEAYSVFCSATDPAKDQCECKGFARGGYCKHVDACRALLGNLWI